jgi:hypothetical protein
MDRQHTRRSPGAVLRVRRIRPTRDPRPPIDAGVRGPASSPGDETAIALLADILVGERDWTLAEIRQLIALRESAERGRFRVPGLDGGASDR